MTDRPPGDEDDAASGASDGGGDLAEDTDTSRGGTWLTYRYRFGGAGTPEAMGTIKAPSFLSAARRLLARRLAGPSGSASAYLRLRAAGQEEMLLRVVGVPGERGGGVQLEQVPTETYHFPEPPIQGAGGA